MKRFLTILLLSGTISGGFAQKSISASEILKKIDNGESVTYKNVVIEGELDFTDLRNQRQTSSSLNFFGGDNDTYESSVEASISFIDCTFNDDVLAYYHDERGNDTYIAHFEGDVIFQNCNFKRKSEFKYSEFQEKVDFSKTIFNREANFKYAEFSEQPSFASVEFRDDANFKYSEFPYGANFESATFEELANFKYTKFRSPVNFDNTSFEGSEDFKYTRVDGRSFTTFLLKNRK